MTRQSTPYRACSRGMALLFALLLLLATMAIGLAAARVTFGAVHAARFEHARAVARGAAEAAMRDAERDIAAGGTPLTARAALFAAADTAQYAAAWPAGCGHGDVDRGLCAVQTPPAWQALDLAAPGNPALARFGDVTGAAMATGAASLPARLPAYLIERLALPGTYRVTAIGFGTRASTTVVLQALYRKADPAAPHPGWPLGRIGLREIANWSELHAQAAP